MFKNNNKKAFKTALQQGAGPTGLFVTVVGFFSDFVKPLINLVPYFFVGSLAFAVILWFGFITRGKKPEEVDTIKEILESKFGVIFGVAVVSTVFWLVMIPVFALTPQLGVVASVIPPAGDLQHMMMSRFDNIDAKVDADLPAVLSKIDAIDKGAVVIAQPQSYNDYYHNARVYELTGNSVEARKSYEKYFQNNLSYYDPVISYVQIVKSLEGPSSTQEILAKLRDQYPKNPAITLVYAINKSAPEDKEFLLNKLALQYPDYGPIFYAQLEFYSYQQSGILTLTEQKKTQMAFAKLTELEKNKGFSKFFIDKALLAEKQEFIKVQENLNKSYYDQINKNGFNHGLQ